MAPAIIAEGLCKNYQIGARTAGGYRTLRESFTDAAGAPLRRIRALLRRGDDRLADREFRALHDVSFSIARGESVGIIGRNGAGKSTLLKLLSRITTPSRGEIRLRGRVGSLLEVGTGFHPELTGRENIFLNGSIMGMTRREIARQYDRIVQFSEIGDFIDTPVKRYSSGMYVKLAFAVAAHMEPDILLIDEVLSVGDLAFQRKCMEHAQKMLSKNATLLFVSHNMFAIKAMCDRAIYLDRGTILADGPTEKVAQRYDRDGRLDIVEWAREQLGSDPDRCPISIKDATVLDEAGEPCGLVEHGRRLKLRMKYETRSRIERPNFSVSFVRSDGIGCCNYNMSMDGVDLRGLAGRGEIELEIPQVKLTADTYTIHILVWDPAFQRLYCAQVGPSVNVRHPVLSTQFGVFHEQANWRVPSPSAEPLVSASSELTR